MKFKLLLTLSFFAACCIGTIDAQCLLWDTENLKTLKSRSDSPLYQNIVNGGNYFLTQMPVAVTRKGQSFSGEYHNYESLSFYTWPNPEDPNGPWVTRHGYINPQYKEFDFERLLTLQAAARYMALSYYVTRDQRYHEGLQRWIKAWFVDEETCMYPQMEYAQVRPGEYGNHGTPWGIVEAYSLLDVLESYQLVNDLKPFDKEIDAKMHDWTRAFSNWLMTSNAGKAECRMGDMHSIAYDVILYYFSAFNNDKKVMKNITKGFVERLNSQIDEEGKMPREMAGQRVFHDHLYNIQHIVDFCMMQKRQGKNYYHQQKKLIDRAVLFLLPYLKAPETFPYTQVTDWDTDISDFKIELMRLGRLNAHYSSGYEADPFETEITVVK